MYRKLARFSLLIFLLTLLTGCTPVQPEKVEQPGPAAASPEATAQQYAGITPVPAMLAGCTNVKSYGFNMGASVGNRICVEGTISKITTPGPDNRVEIPLDTSTSKSGGSLYTVTVFIPDASTFGPDLLNQLSSGQYIAVKGQFSQGWNAKNFIATYYIEISKPDDLAVLG